MPKKWIDPNGLEIPSNRVTKEEKNKEKVVDKCHKLASIATEKLAEARNEIYDLVEEFLEESAHYAKLKKWKGNASITNFEGTLRVKKDIKNNVQPDDNIHICKQIVDECLSSWSKGAKKELQEVIKSYFHTDSKGEYRLENLIRLKKTKVDDPRWNEAMSYLDKSLNVVSSKAYYSVEFKNKLGEWERIPLNFHEIMPETLKDESEQSEAA
ncbi:MAG: DUF3164 family protein [Balneola sp.]